MIKTGKYLDMINGSQESAENKEIQFSPPSSDFEDDQKKYGSIDPRRDKSVDHQYWEDILWNAWHFTKPLYYILHGIRCEGGELTLTKDSFRLLPGEWPATEWEEVKQKHLDSVKDSLIKILKLTRVGKVTEEQLPAGLFEKMEQGRLFG